VRGYGPVKLGNWKVVQDQRPALLAALDRTALAAAAE